MKAKNYGSKKKLRKMLYYRREMERQRKERAVAYCVKVEHCVQDPISLAASMGVLDEFMHSSKGFCLHNYKGGFK